MGLEFKPLEDIARDNSIGVGDLFVLRELPSNANSQSTTESPVYCGIMDTYTVSDENPCGLEVGKMFHGIRVFDHKYNGNLNATKVATVFHDSYKGLLIPFESTQQYEYAPLG